MAADGIADVLLGGWQVNGVMSLMSGTPINIIQGNAVNLNAGGSGQYPDQVKPDVAILGGVGVGNEYFDRSAYAAVNIPAGQPQRFGNSGRNPIRGPGFWNVDLGLFERSTSPGEAAVPRRGAERPESPELREPGRRHLERRHVRVHHGDDGNRRTEPAVRRTRLVLRRRRLSRLVTRSIDMKE